MLYTLQGQGGLAGGRRDQLVKAAAGVDLNQLATSTARSPWEAIGEWAQALADRVAGDQPAQHVAVFVHDSDVDALRLVGQVWGAAEDTGAVVVGIWTLPLEGSICGRVYRTRAAALCADISLDPDYRSFPGGRTRSSLTVPFGPDDTVVGVINVEAPWTSAFSIADYERLTQLAVSAAAAMPRLGMASTPRFARPDEDAPPAA
jgi:GAF domain-containing protein